ncbi:MAG TPA: DUF262 domain-containing HNH endonuclease family protein [Ilumatobacteraceae bacterium]|nr:DUF262 domain-containing HNH endonuclease family protein [Ilumatobacteraceae bacterium]
MATDQLIHPASFLTASTTTLQTLLTSNHYAVPDYQRDFSWTKEEVGELWADLLLTAQNAYTPTGQGVPSPRPHFIGAIVLQSYPTAMARRPELMDGQQRLVTLTALMSILVEFARGIANPTDRNAWEASLQQMVTVFVGGVSQPRLELARDHQHYVAMFCDRWTEPERAAYVASQATPPKRSVLARLRDMAACLHQSVKDYVNAAAPQDRDRLVIQLIRSISQLTVVLEMRVEEQGVAYEVFESLNARGLELQQADLLKNRLFSLADAQGTKPQVAAAWDRIVKSIEQQSWISLTEFLFFHFVATYGDARQADLYQTVNRHLSSGTHTAVDYATNAAVRAEDLQTTLEAGATFSAAVARDVESLRDLVTNKYSLTLLIAGAQRHALNSAEFGTVARLAHRFVFRGFIVEDIPIGQYMREIKSAARDYTSGALPDGAALAVRLNSHSLDAVFASRFAEYSAPNHRLGFYALEMIENHLSAASGTYVHRQSPAQHLEHIMPKSPTQADWPHVYGNPLYSDFLNRLGNLLVLEADINRSVKNRAFALKNSRPGNKDYQNSHLKLPVTCQTFLDAAGNWSFQSIVDRQNALATAYAVPVWQLS